MPVGKHLFPVRHVYLYTLHGFVLFGMLLCSSCQKPVDEKKVLGKWAIRKDSSEMSLVFTPDSLIISYLPEKSRFAYTYVWKQEEEEGLMECNQEQPLHTDERERKVITSRFYILKVSTDSISVWIPGKKMRYDLKRSN
ncbi:MAG TPA: hypothetical protein VNZ86_19410 [Bacteroidia bacterium]|jgi:hypothetical protein|nr:hypothetical protein [Bacteroidia bacterium]